MKDLTSIQQYLIDYIIADNEERELPNPITPYMQALKGGFKPPFSLYSTGPILYVQDYEQFHIQGIKNQFLEIADFIGYLAQEGYIRTIWEEPEKPLNIPEHWQSFTDFTVSEGKTLGFAGSFRLIPRLALYEYWEALRRKAPVQEAVCYR